MRDELVRTMRVNENEPVEQADLASCKSPRMEKMIGGNSAVRKIASWNQISLNSSTPSTRMREAQVAESGSFLARRPRLQTLPGLDGRTPSCNSLSSLDSPDAGSSPTVFDMLRRFNGARSNSTDSATSEIQSPLLSARSKNVSDAYEQFMDICDSVLLHEVSGQTISLGSLRAHYATLGVKKLAVVLLCNLLSTSAPKMYHDTKNRLLEGSEYDAVLVVGSGPPVFINSFCAECDLPFQTGDLCSMQGDVGVKVVSNTCRELYVAVTLLACSNMYTGIRESLQTRNEEVGSTIKRGFENLVRVSETGTSSGRTQNMSFVVFNNETNKIDSFILDSDLRYDTVSSDSS